jgi:hypothetical protein
MPTNPVANLEQSRLLAGHEPPLLRAIIILVILIRRRSQRSHIQFACVKGHYRSTLTRNSDKRSVIVHATPPMGCENRLPLLFVSPLFAFMPVANAQYTGALGRCVRENPGFVGKSCCLKLIQAM